LQGIQRASGRHDIMTCPECRRESRVPSGNLNDLPTNSRINSLLDELAIKEEEANKRKLQVKSVIESQKKQVQHQKNKVNNIEQTCIQIQEQAAAVKQNAQKFKEAVLRIMEAKTQEICNKVDNQAAESIQSLVTQKSEIDNQVEMTETVIEQAETLLERSSSAAIVELDKSLSTIFQQGFVNSEKEIVDCDLEGLCRFMFVENKTLMDKVNAEGIGSFNTGFGKTSVHQSRVEGKGTSEAVVGLEANFVLTTRDAEGVQCYHKYDCLTVEIRNRQGQSSAKKARVQDNRNGSYRISYFAKETGKCDVSVKVNGQQVHGSPFAVEVRTRQYRCVLSFGAQGSAAGMLSRPWGVAVNERDEIAVTDNGNNRIQVFNSDWTYLRSFGRRGDKNGEFNFPAGIGFDKNDNIIVVDTNNSRVQRFSEQGEHLNTFSSQGKLDHQLNGPRGLSVNSDGNVVVADKWNKLIKIFRPTGQFLRAIGRGSSFASPYHCVQYESYLVVSDRDEHCIKVFDTAGKFLYKFGKKGEGEGEFDTPGCLSINKAGHLIVCDIWNHRVQVFDLSGNFVAKFGTKGSKIGEFSRPLSTAVLSDGRIVVTDVDNSRIQIFE